MNIIKNKLINLGFVGISIFTYGQDTIRKNHTDKYTAMPASVLNTDSTHHKDGIEAIINIDLNGDGKLDEVMARKSGQVIHFMRDSLGILKEMYIDKHAQTGLDLNNDGISEDITTMYGNTEFKLIKKSDAPKGIYNKYILAGSVVHKPRYQY